MDLDKISQEIPQRLHQLSDDQVLAVADHLQIPEKEQEKVRGKGRNGGLRLINRFLSREEVDDMEDGGLKMLMDLEAFLDELLGAKKDKENPGDASKKNAARPTEISLHINSLHPKAELSRQKTRQWNSYLGS